MTQKVKLAVIGLGKMGLSHLSIANAHPSIEVVAVCDSALYVRDLFARYTSIKVYSDFSKMLANEVLDAVLIATPSRLHGEMVLAAVRSGLHVFCEKPFILDTAVGALIVEEARNRNLVNQVGYHYRFVGSFRELKRLVLAGSIGRISHVEAEAYGPVVLRPKSATWRTSGVEGGGCLYDYACHALDLMNFVAGSIASVRGAQMNSVFSRDVDDEVYANLTFSSGASGSLAANWSDESFRKMSTKVTVWGDNGRITADRQEVQIYSRTSNPALNLLEGWTVRYTTELTEPTWFYLRGEEYSAQIDHFVQCIIGTRSVEGGDFSSALETDRVALAIRMEATRPGTPIDTGLAIPVQRSTRSAYARLFGKGDRK